MENYFNLQEIDKLSYTVSDIENIERQFFKNLNILDYGTIAAGTSSNLSDGGSYFYHWIRDASICIYRIMLIYPYNKYINIVKKYVEWVQYMQSQEEVNGIDVRGEPKFNLPDGTIYQGPWARPQNDGASLCSIALIYFAKICNKRNEKNYVNEFLVPLINNELDFVLDNYNNLTFDLWEEVNNTNFFNNKILARYALIQGLPFTKNKEEFHKSVNDLSLQILDHWNGIAYTESNNRLYDSAVIMGLVFNFGHGIDELDVLITPTDAKIAKTVLNLNQIFSESLPINLDDLKNNIPGILYGRYEGDQYNGGNAWIWTTAILACLFFICADYVKQNGLPDQNSIDAWKNVFNYHENILDSKSFIQLFIHGGNSILERLYYHTKDNDGNLYEQIDKNTGFMTSSQNLSVSCISILFDLYIREKIGSLKPL